MEGTKRSLLEIVQVFVAVEWSTIGLEWLLSTKELGKGPKPVFINSIGNTYSPFFMNEQF